MGFTARGVEPVTGARETAARLAQHFGATLEIIEGTAEHLPFADATFHVVLANSVLEHVEDLEQALAEAFRVLKPGGVFWFSSTSALCPRQHEIRGFPLFGWYPLALKRRLMYWAKRHRPGLIGHTQTPAIHWFTPWMARRLLRKAGFTQVYDRWDLRRRVVPTGWRRWLFAIITANVATKCLADVIVEGSAYAAVKP
jgi:2-polyprenyl-6-hydroxyphenyl methylase/3-demethylubiquinone-9 3-methyltransferase